MRNYPCNSPQAATRILALAMLADGHACSTEFAVLERLQVHAELGLPRHELQAVMQDFCEDRLACAAGLSWLDACLMDGGPLEQMLQEVSEPALKRKVMALCLSLVAADRQFTPQEALLLGAMGRQWDMHFSPALSLPQG
ncbi:MAG: TerB family tellurite resistance protein [Pseudomonadota bacterium]|nr:TerB family tellurite resistance protein [Pseudomonadota bacterium]